MPSVYKSSRVALSNLLHRPQYLHGHDNTASVTASTVAQL